MNQLTKYYSPFCYANYVEYLKDVREQYGERKKPISLRLWAERLGYKSSRILELVLSGARTPSEELLVRLAKDLKLSLKEQKYLNLLVKREKILKKNKPVFDIEDEMRKMRPPRFEAQFISNEIFHRVSEWYPLVIRQLAMTPEFQNNINWINSKLRGKATNSQIISALAEWQNLAFDRRALYTAEDVPSLAVRTFHKKMLQKAIQAIDEVDLQNRECISITFRASKNKLADMKKALREIRDQFNEDFSQDKANEIFQLSMILYPHTNLSSKN